MKHFDFLAPHLMSKCALKRHPFLFDLFLWAKLASCFLAFYLSIVLSRIYANSTSFRRVPILEIHTSILVPGTRYRGGFMPAPTPELLLASFIRNRESVPRKRKGAIKCNHATLTTRGAGHDDTALLQGSALGQVGDEIGAVEEEVVDALVLARLAVDDGLEVQLRRVADQLRGHETRAHGREGVEALGEPPLRHAAGQVGVALQFARRHVVAGSVRGDIVEGVLDRDVLRVAPDDHTL